MVSIILCQSKKTLSYIKLKNFTLYYTRNCHLTKVCLIYYEKIYTLLYTRRY